MSIVLLRNLIRVHRATIRNETSNQYSPVRKCKWRRPGLHHSTIAIQIRSKCASVQTIMNSLKFGLLVILCFLVIDQSQCAPDCTANEDCRPCGRGKNTEGTWLMPISLLQSFRTFQNHFGLCDFLTKSFTTAIFLGNSLINGI